MNSHAIGVAASGALLFLAPSAVARADDGGQAGARPVAPGSRIVPNTGSRVGNPTVPSASSPPRTPAPPRPHHGVPPSHPTPPTCLPGVPCYPGGWNGGVIVYPPYPYYPWGPWPYGPYPYDAYYTYGPLTVGQLGQIDPNLAIGPAQPAAQAPPPDPGVEALRSGDFDTAVAAFSQRMYAEPENPEVSRSLAVALLGAGSIDRAASVMAGAYLKRPELSASPVDVDGLLGGPAQVRALLNRAVAQAHRSPSADLWLLVAVLMQGEGRNGVAAQMLERAAALGLDPAVEKAMSNVLGPAPKTP